MPKVTLSYKKGIFTRLQLLHIGEEIKTLVAEAASTLDTKLTGNDVDFFAREHTDFDLAADVGIEIETIGFPQRRAKLGERNVILKLKKGILASSWFPKISPDSPLIWIKFWDPVGLHV